jgi:hypothetical protein
MFTEEIENFLKKDMCICLVHLKEEINKFIDDVELISLYIKELVNLKLPNRDFELGSEEFYENEESFKSFIRNFLSKNKISRENNNWYIFDTLGHAFHSYKMGGLIALYENQNNEEWYLKIVINKFLGKEEDILKLSERVTIYRGTSLEEYESGIFSQAWSLNIEKAKEFAFSHYSRQEIFIGTTRVVIKTEIPKSEIFYYSDENEEKEVVLNSFNINKEQVVKVLEEIIE